MGSVPQAALVVVGSQQTAQQKKSAAVYTPTRGVSRLMYACQQGDVDKVRKILRQQVSDKSKEYTMLLRKIIQEICTLDKWNNFENVYS